MRMQWQQDEHDKKNGTHGCDKPTGTEQCKNSPHGQESTKEGQKTQPEAALEDYPEETISKLKAENEWAPSRRMVESAQNTTHWRTERSLIDHLAWVY